MKHRRKGCWPVIRAILLAVALAGLSPVPSALLAAVPATSHFESKLAEGGPVIAFTDGDYQFSASQTVPVSGWQHKPSPNIFRDPDLYWDFSQNRVMWGRHRFDRAALGKEPFAIVTISCRNQFRVLLNGREIFRNYASSSDRKQSWYRPYLIPVAPGLLRPGINEIAIRAESNESVGIGKIIIGPHIALQHFYETSFFWRIIAPSLASFAMLVLGALSFAAWLSRRRETELLFLSLLTVLCFLRYHRFFAENVMFDGGLYSAISFYSTYYAAAAATAFYVAFLKMPYRRVIVIGVFALGLPLMAAHTLFHLSDGVVYAGACVVSVGMLIFGGYDMARDRSLEKLVVSAVMMLMPVTAVYDLTLFNAGRAWNSGEFYISVFNGFFYALAFLASFGMRALKAFTSLNAANQTLALRIAETRRDLAQSEAERRQLVVGQAVASERDRLMQEIHDGIGSNLITALAIAEQQDQPSSTIKTLRRAIADLKLTVDSLEPVEGDLVALLGNLRHRMSGDLRDAGLTCRWEVQPCGNISWLDAPNALHVLRIFQEAIGNVLTHSAATEMRIGCRDELRGEVPGIAAYVADNGVGFDPAAHSGAGKGLSGIQGRARSLHGELDLAATPGAGAIVTLWLPYVRTMPPVAGAAPLGRIGGTEGRGAA